VRTTSTLFQTVPPGTVSNADPAPGTTASFGSAVNLTIEGGLIGLSASSVLVGSAAGSSSVFLTVQQASTQGPWSATANNSFLHLAAGSSSGSGSAWIAFTIDAFSGTGIRNGTLTIAGLTFTVTQAGTDYVAASQSTTPIQGGFSAPSGVAVDGFGNLYIADTANNVVKKWSVATQQVSTLISSGVTGPTAVTVDGDGNLYIADSAAIHFWSASTQQLMTLVSGITSGSDGVAVDASGNVYFSTVSPATISEWMAATQTVTPLVSSGLSSPRGMALDSSGNVYFADGGNNAVKLWSAATQQVTTLVGTGLARPWGMAVDGSTGDVYFCDMQNSAVKLWSAATQQVMTVVQGSPAGTSNRYRGLARGASGNLYFAEIDANVIGQLSKAYISSGSLSEPNSAGSDALPPVVPITTNLGAPVSDQPWLTVGTTANGIVNFSYAVNASGSPRTGHITVLGIPFTVNQGLLVAVPNVNGLTQAAATTAITGAGLAAGSVTTAPSGTVAAGSVISTNPAAGAQVSPGSAVSLQVSTGPAQVAAGNVTGQLTVTRGALVFNRATSLYAQSVTVSNSGAAIASAAFVLDNLAAGYTLYQSSGVTAATAPVGSPYQEIGPINAGATVTFTIELTRTGTPALLLFP
jgi:sugar lactone lactonase YvrE